ncbi:MAG: hypothetical protein AAFQ65_04175 [Myxococcota bacterium]
MSEVRRLMRSAPKAALSMLMLSVFACTDAEIYSSTGLEPFQPDRVAIAGELCTEDTSGSRFPVKVLLVVDGSQDMFRADPNGERFFGPPGAISNFIERNRNQPNIRFGFVELASNAVALPQPNGQQFFRPQDPEIQLALTQLQTPPVDPQRSNRDVINALSQTESFIASDIANSPAGETLRTRYVVFMLLAGPPRPQVDTSILAQRTDQLRDFVLSRGALDFSLNIGLLYYGPRSIDLGVAPFNCYESIGACACPTVAVGDAYCAINCDVTSGAVDYDAEVEEAQELYESITFVGNGTTELFPCPSTIDTSVDVVTASVQLVKKDIVAFNQNALLGETEVLADSDGDGLTDRDERNAGTDLTRPDTDGDGLGDRIEFRLFPRQDPLLDTDRPRSCFNPGVGGTIPDLDFDLLNDCEESLIETSASIPDTDGDGLPDYLEIMSGNLPTSAEDRLLDFDGDGVPNGAEVLAHTNPRTNDGRLRDQESYRNQIVDLGNRVVPLMEDSDQLRAVTFLRSSENVVGGPAFLEWNPDARTLAWSDARFASNPQYDPIPVQITGSGEYILEASTQLGIDANGDPVLDFAAITVFVDADELPAFPVTASPLITLADLNCFDVRISNIKLVETEPTVLDPEPGLNRILVFFTQGPADRLDSPGIASVAEFRVRFQCTEDGCSRTPGGATLPLNLDSFVGR